MTDTVTLEPCPFCGKEGWLFKHSSAYTDEYSVRCENGCCEVGDEYRDEATRLWNTRASQPVEPKGPFATHGSGAALNTSGGQTYAMPTPPLDSEAVERVALALRDEADRKLNANAVNTYPPSKVEDYVDFAKAALLSLAKPVGGGE